MPRWAHRICIDPEQNSFCFSGDTYIHQIVRCDKEKRVIIGKFSSTPICGTKCEPLGTVELQAGKEAHFRQHFIPLISRNWTRNKLWPKFKLLWGCLCAIWVTLKFLQSTFKSNYMRREPSISTISAAHLVSSSPVLSFILIFVIFSENPNWGRELL